MTRRVLVWTHDVTGAQSGAIGRDFLDLFTDVTLDEDERLVFEIPASHPKAYLLAEDLQLRKLGRTYYIGELTQERRGSETTIRVEAPAIWQRLADVDVPGSMVLDDVTPAAGGATILDGSGWTVGGATVTTGAFSMESQDRTVLANIRTWAKITGTFVEFDTQDMTVDWVASRGQDVGLAFRKGRNLRNILRRRTPPKVTQLLPYGRDDLTIAGVNAGEPFVEDATFYTAQGIDFDATAPDGRTYRQIYGKRRVVRDQSFVKDTDLLAWAETQLAIDAQSIQSVELDVVDISEITGADEQIAPGDRARAYDPDFDEEFTATVTRFKRYDLQPWRNEIELSTSPALVSDPDQSAGRPNQSDEWLQFVGPIRGDYQIRNDGDYITSRIPLRFREGGRANFHLDLWATGVDAGDLVVTVIDATAEPEEQQFKQVTVPYTNGSTVRAHLSWAAEELTGAKDYRVRVTTTATGGADPAKGVNIDADATAPAEASFYIMAQGAVQETPVAENSELFEYNGDKSGGDGSTQQFQVPDNVTEIAVTVAGSQGAGSGTPGRGSTLRFKMLVTPGTTYDIDVGGCNDLALGHVGGWPNGGAGALYSNRGGGGGGSTSFRLEGNPFTSSIAVAPGGGGATGNTVPRGDGGDSGFYEGQPGTNGGGPSKDPGEGATQFAPGAAGDSGVYSAEDGDTDGQGYGGDALPTGDVGTSNTGSGGGGGGWHGGGGGAGYYAGGGGGAGYIDATNVFDLEISDAENASYGYALIEWETSIDSV